MTARRLVKRIRPPKKRAHADARALFMAGGIVASLLLLALVLQQVVPTGHTIVEKLPPPEFSDYVPAGTSLAGVTLEIEDLPQSSYAVTYEYDMLGGAGLAIIEWDKERAKYVLSGTVAPTEEGMSSFASVDGLELESMGTGERVIVARGTSEDGQEGVALISLDHGPAIVWYRISYASPLPAAWFSGGGVSTTVTFEDVDGDGTKEVVETSMLADDPSGTGTVRVYRWQESDLVIDENLSNALTMSKSIFPEPPADAEAE